MQRNGAIGRKEFIALMALLMSVIAMAIDAMLPALGEIGLNGHGDDGHEQRH